MFFVIGRRRAALCLCAAACLVILAAVLWSGGASSPAAEAVSALAGGREAARVVVIDAGHGGADGGAVAEDGTREAAINLAVARRLEAVCIFLGAETVMVRREDVSIHSSGVEGLRDQKVSDIHNRVDLVNRTEDAVLISIHQNSLPQVPSVHGAQVFYNSAEAAAGLAAAVQAALNQAINPGNEKQERAIGSSVYLMEHIHAPGILVECGFLSNPQETQSLKAEDYQTKLALTIAAGYFQYESTRENKAGETHEE